MKFYHTFNYLSITFVGIKSNDASNNLMKITNTIIT